MLENLHISIPPQGKSCKISSMIVQVNKRHQQESVSDLGNLWNFEMRILSVWTAYGCKEFALPFSNTHIPRIYMLLPSCRLIRNPKRHFSSELSPKIFVILSAEIFRNQNNFDVIICSTCGPTSLMAGDGTLFKIFELTDVPPKAMNLRNGRASVLAWDETCGGPTYVAAPTPKAPTTAVLRSCLCLVTHVFYCWKIHNISLK